MRVYFAQKKPYFWLVSLCLIGKGKWHVSLIGIQGIGDMYKKMRYAGLGKVHE